MLMLAFTSGISEEVLFWNHAILHMLSAMTCQIFQITLRQTVTTLAQINSPSIFQKRHVSFLCRLPFHNAVGAGGKIKPFKVTYITMKDFITVCFLSQYCVGGLIPTRVPLLVWAELMAAVELSVMELVSGDDGAVDWTRSAVSTERNPEAENRVCSDETSDLCNADYPICSALGDLTQNVLLGNCSKILVSNFLIYNLPSETLHFLSTNQNTFDSEGRKPICSVLFYYADWYCWPINYITYVIIIIFSIY